MKMSWIYYAILAGIFVAGWAIFVKIALKGINFEVVAFITPIVAAALVGSYILLRQNLTYTVPSLQAAVIAGVSLGMFYLLFAKSLSIGGPLVRAVPTYATVYILIITMVGLIFLRENFSVKIGLGIILAILSIIFLTT